MSKFRKNLVIITTILIIVAAAAFIVYKEVQPAIPTEVEQLNESQNVVIELPSGIKLQSLGAYSSSNDTISIPKNLYIHLYPPNIKGYYIVQFKGTNPEEYKSEVTNLGGEFFGFISNDAYFVKMNDSTKDKVQKLDVIQWIGIYQPAYKIRSGLLNEKGDVILNILIFGSENITEISHKIESIGGMAPISSGNLVKIRINASTIPEIANIIGVMWIEKYSMPTIYSIQISASSTQSQLIQEKIKSKLIGFAITYYGIAGNALVYNVSENDIKMINETLLDNKRVWKVRIGEGMTWDYYFDEDGENIVKVVQLFRT